MLPKFITNKKAVFNPPCSNELSLPYCVATEQKRLLYYRAKRYYELRASTFGNVNYPVSISDVDKLKLKSKTKINIYTIDDKNGYNRRCIYYSNHKENEQCKYVLYYNGRFYQITRFPAFLRGPGKQSRAAYYCDRCLLRFSNEDIWCEHRSSCNSSLVFGIYDEMGKLKETSLPAIMTPFQTREKRTNRKKKKVKTIDSSTMTVAMDEAVERNDQQVNQGKLVEYNESTDAGEC